MNPMKTVLQRVSEASVSVDGQEVAAINQGIMALVGFGAEDSQEPIPRFLQKVTQLRIFSDAAGRFQHSLVDIQGALLLVPQFTLYADTNKGRRPEFFGALAPEKARVLFDELVAEAKKLMADRVGAGIFGADMKVRLVNDGPVTITLEIT